MTANTPPPATGRDTAKPPAPQAGASVEAHDNGPVSAIHDALCPIRQGHGQCEWPTDHTRTVYDAAAAILASDWLAQRDAAVRAEAGERIAVARAEALEKYAPMVWESGRAAGIIDALRAHGPDDPKERLLWAVMTPATDSNPYENEPFDFAGHDESLAEDDAARIARTMGGDR